MQIDWRNLDWRVLEELRANYLNPGSEGVADYWQDLNYLRHYDQTFGQRIAWKWRAVCEELRQRYPTLRLFFRPRILDFACGTGSASREWLRHFVDSDSKCHIGLTDRSLLAMQFTRERIQAEHSVAQIELWDKRVLERDWDICLISHVVNEMGVRGVDLLTDLVRRSPLAVLVEPGTPAAAKALCVIREQVLTTHVPLAPCTHAQGCGMAALQRAGDWCHHFAKPPNLVFRDAGWAEFAKRLGIDLRSLPVSYLVLARRDALPEDFVSDAAQQRIIGRARVYKGYVKALVCDETGVTEQQMQKRADPQLYKELDKDHPFAKLISPHHTCF